MLGGNERARLALLCVAQFVVVLDATIVAIALPAIGADLEVQAPGLQWFLSAYTLTFGGGLMLAGRAADLFGRRRVFRIGLVVFALASLGCALASTAAALVAARAVQGAGAALVAPSALALLVATEPAGAARSRALAIWTAAPARAGPPPPRRCADGRRGRRRRRRVRLGARRPHHQRPRLGVGIRGQRPDRPRRRGAGRPLVARRGGGRERADRRGGARGRAPGRGRGPPPGRAGRPHLHPRSGRGAP